MATVLLAEAPCETLGSDAAQRYHCQALWGLTLLIGVHETRPDYAPVLELHDDLALLDNATAPPRISFYQAKTRETGHWTITDLLARKKTARKAGGQAKLPSILGKTYDNVVCFGDRVDMAAFVSNADVGFAPSNLIAGSSASEPATRGTSRRCSRNFGMNIHSRPPSKEG